jgi:hypothetical protein
MYLLLAMSSGASKAGNREIRYLEEEIGKRSVVTNKSGGRLNG